MSKYDRVVIKKSTNPKKKLMATFSNKSGEGRSKTTHFGSAGMSDFPTHKDEARRQRYLDRHRKRENWSDPQSAGALSRWILWELPTRSTSISKYKRRFGFK